MIEVENTLPLSTDMFNRLNKVKNDWNKIVRKYSLVEFLDKFQSEVWDKLNIYHYLPNSPYLDDVVITLAQWNEKKVLFSILSNYLTQIVDESISVLIEDKDIKSNSELINLLKENKISKESIEMILFDKTINSEKPFADRHQLLNDVRSKNQVDYVQDFITVQNLVKNEKIKNKSELSEYLSIVGFDKNRSNKLIKLYISSLNINANSNIKKDLGIIKSKRELEIAKDNLINNQNSSDEINNQIEKIYIKKFNLALPYLSLVKQFKNENEKVVENKL